MGQDSEERAQKWLEKALKKGCLTLSCTSYSVEDPDKFSNLLVYDEQPGLLPVDSQ